MVATTQVEVPLETGTSECRGVVQNDDGSRSRGYQWATLRTLVDHAGLLTQGGLCPMQVHALPLCRLLFETAPVLRAGELLWEDRGFVEGATLTLLKPQRHVEVSVPLQSTMLSYTEAVQLAERAGEWRPHPSRDHQHIACVKGVEPLGEACQVPLNACVMRSWNRKKAALDHLVLVTTAQRLPGPWSVRHEEERPEIAQDDEQMKRGGWPLKKLRSTRDSAIVLYSATVVLSYSLSPLFANTQAGARLADKTRQALACEQLRTRRTHGIA